MPLGGSAAERAEHVATRTAAKWRAFGRDARLASAFTLRAMLTVLLSSASGAEHDHDVRPSDRFDFDDD